MGDHQLHPTVAVKELRERTGMGYALCASAWKASGGHMEKALEILKAKGADRAERLQDRSTSAAYIGSYKHHDGRTVALFTLLTETDFVTKMPETRQLAQDLAMHLVAEGYIPMHRDGTIDYDSLNAQEVLLRDNCTVRELVQQLSAKTGEKITIGMPVLLKV